MYPEWTDQGSSTLCKMFKTHLLHLGLLCVDWSLAT